MKMARMTLKNRLRTFLTLSSLVRFLLSSICFLCHVSTASIIDPLHVILHTKILLRALEWKYVFLSFVLMDEDGNESMWIK